MVLVWWEMDSEERGVANSVMGATVLGMVPWIRKGMCRQAGSERCYRSRGSSYLGVSWWEGVGFHDGHSRKRSQKGELIRYAAPSSHLTVLSR